jgi:hypothetical protein
MDQKANPIPTRGERNVCCPFYNGCLDYAVRGSWQTWNCCQCPHKLIRQAMTQWECEINNIDLCYDLPANVRRKIWKEAFD